MQGVSEDICFSKFALSSVVSKKINTYSFSWNKNDHDVMKYFVGSDSHHPRRRHGKPLNTSFET